MFKRMALLGLSVAIAGCSSLASLSQPSTFSVQASKNGRAGVMPAFYDATLFTINLKEMPAQASASLIAHNASINMIYVTEDLDEPQTFVAVIDAIQGDGFNPLWRQVLIVFNPGFTPHQFFSDTEVLAAAAAGEITLVPTDEVYRCSVLGPGPKRPS